MSAEIGSPLNRPLRIGLIGSGFMAGLHVEAFRSVRDCFLAAVYSLTADHRNEMVKRINALGLGPCRGFDSVEEMAGGGGVDAVWIVGPNFTRLEHMEAISRAMEGGRSSLRAVACEKPLGRNVAEAKRMLDLATATGLNHGYLENQVFAPGVRKGREVMWRRAAAISGRPYLARASEEHSGPHRPWFWQGERQGGGVLLDMMCHSVEVARFLLTEPGAERTGVLATTATGHVSTLKWSRPEYADRLRQSMGEGVDYLARPSEDTAQGVIEFHDRDGHPLMIEATTSWAYVGPGLRIAIEVLGPEYSMKLDSLSSGLQLFFSRFVEGTAGEDLVEKQNAEQGLWPVIEDEAVAYGYVAENRHMVEAFSLGKPPEETWADGLAVVELLMGLYRSAELRRTISFEDEDLADYIPPVGRPAGGADMTADQPAAPAHPLDSLTMAEIGRAVELVRAVGLAPEGTWFSDVELVEPTRWELERFADREAVDRRVRIVLVTGPATEVTETVVSLTSDQVVSSTEVAGVCSTILDEESFYAAELLKADPEWQAAMARRGISDFDTVVIDPWPAGRYGLEIEEGCRLARCTSYVKEKPTDNMYARPVDGVIGFVDTGRRRVVRVDDHGVVPVPPVDGSYLPDDIRSIRTGLRPLEIVQPEGPSFTIEAGLLQWQGWSMRVSMNAHEGLVLHTIGYEDGGRVRPILFRASIDEMVVPYGAPGPMHSWKNAFDASEWGLGKAANSLVQGCDCLGEIRYLDAAFATERGRPYRVRNAVCIHEEDSGVAWRHTDIGAGTNEVRRGRRLVVSSFATAGNYDYGFFWYFFLDGTIECEVKLTGIVSTEAVAGDRPLTHATRVSEYLAAPNHQHIFNARLHFDVEGPSNSVFEVDVATDEAGVDNELGATFSARPTPLESEQEAQRLTDPAAGRVWKVTNPGRLNSWGDPVAYKLVPGPTPTLMARPDSSVARRAAFATRNLWVTPYSPDERRAAGEYPNQHVGGDGLPRWTAANRPLIETDLVLWYSFGVTHIPRPEDFPIMPVERIGFALVPSGFFDRNPALDLPAPEACH